MVSMNSTVLVLFSTISMNSLCNSLCLRGAKNRLFIEHSSDLGHLGDGKLAAEFPSCRASAVGGVREMSLLGNLAFPASTAAPLPAVRSEEHTSELQSRGH